MFSVIRDTKISIILTWHLYLSVILYFLKLHNKLPYSRISREVYGIYGLPGISYIILSHRRKLIKSTSFFLYHNYYYYIRNNNNNNIQKSVWRLITPFYSGVHVSLSELSD